MQIRIFNADKGLDKDKKREIITAKSVRVAFSFFSTHEFEAGIGRSLESIK
jgi:hypothetical protein